MCAQILKGRKCRSSIEEKTLGQLFFNRANKYNDRICQIDGTIDKTETYASVKLRSTRIAIELQKRGITSKDVITFCSPNNLDIIIAIAAASYLGAAVSNLEASLSVKHTKHLLSLVEPKIIIVEESSVNLIEESLKDVAFRTEIIVFGSTEKYTAFSDLLKPQENEDQFRPLEVDPDNIAVMFFSSGTTGLPKAICHSNKTILRLAIISSELGFKGATFHFATFYWMTAMMNAICTFHAGSYRAFFRKPGARDVFRMIEKYKVEMIFTAPIITYQLTSFEDAQNYDTSSLKVLTCGGTPISPAQLQKTKQLFPSAFVTMCYGMSEIGAVTAFDREFDMEVAEKKITSCGKLAPELQLKVVDIDTEELLGPNQKGEVRIKSPSLMMGYYKLDPSQAFDKDGFLKTGDVGYYDDDECVYLVERIKEMFKYQSFHIVPSAIEATLLELPEIKEAVVFGIPCGEDGDVPAACVVLKDGCSLSTDEIDTLLKEIVADRERLRGGVAFVDNLPKTPTGKIIRQEARYLFLKLKNES